MSHVGQKLTSREGPVLCRFADGGPMMAARRTPGAGVRKPSHKTDCQGVFACGRKADIHLSYGQSCLKATFSQKSLLRAERLQLRARRRADPDVRLRRK